MPSYTSSQFPTMPHFLTLPSYYLTLWYTSFPFHLWLSHYTTLSLSHTSLPSVYAFHTLSLSSLPSISPESYYTHSPSLPYLPSPLTLTTLTLPPFFTSYLCRSLHCHSPTLFYLPSLHLTIHHSPSHSPSIFPNTRKLSRNSVSLRNSPMFPHSISAS